MFQKKIMITLVIMLTGFCIAIAQEYYLAPMPMFDVYEYTDRLEVTFKEGVTRAEVDILIAQKKYTDNKVKILYYYKLLGWYIIQFDEEKIDIESLKALLETEIIVSLVRHTHWLQPIEYTPPTALICPIKPKESEIEPKSDGH